MVRETRGLAKASVVEESLPASIKRKRRGSPTPPTIPLSIPKVVLSVPDHAQTTQSAGNSNGSHHATEEPEVKRAKISLKVKRPATEDLAIPEEVSTQAASHVEPVTPKAERGNGRGLSRDVRGALSDVIEEMAVKLPPPINKILTLWLPPDYTEEPENTLGYVLQQDTLTWESLVDTLQVFCKNLLVPCHYPNPMLPLSQFHLPTATLKSHSPHHPIYAFCAGLHTLMQQIAPIDVQCGVETERWGLVQKVPNQSSSTADNRDWFTAGADPREVDALLTKLGKSHPGEGLEDSLMAKLASTGDRLGYANAIALQSASVSTTPSIRTLNDSVLRKASLKAQRWKEIRLQRSGGFGNSDRSVRIPPMSSLSFTPSFGATYDSNHYFAGYYDTMSAMHERARTQSWNARAKLPVDPGASYRGLLTESDIKSDKGKAKETVEDILAENNNLIAELQGWQELRVQKGKVDWSPEREQIVAQELLASLAKLAAMTGPSELLDGRENASGMAHRLAQRLLQTPSPSIRGVLDPSRPQALHDNLTVRPKSAVAQPLGGSPAAATPPSALTYPPRQSTMYQPPRQQPSYPSPSTPYRPPTPNYTYTSPFQQMTYACGGGAGSGPNVPNHPTSYRPPLAGPSGLRQSFGPVPHTQPQYPVPR